MITFLPAIPERIKPLFDSPASREASESAYDRYCEVYLKFLGRSCYKDVYEAQRAAEDQAVYSMCLTLQRMIAYGGIKV